MNKQVQLYSKWFNNLKLKVFELFWISVFVFEIFGFNIILINSQARSYRGFIKTINRKFVLPNFSLQMSYFHKQVHYWPKRFRLEVHTCTVNIFWQKFRGSHSSSRINWILCHTRCHHDYGHGTTCAKKRFSTTEELKGRNITSCDLIKQTF